MNDVLLQTKLYIPDLRPSLIPRPHLLAKLEQGLDPRTAFFSGRIALICAPAGYGKTMLVSEWLVELTSRNLSFRRQNGRVCWLSLDEQDNDAATRFLGDDDAATQQTLLDTKKEAQAAGDKLVELGSMNMLAQLKVRWGDLRQTGTFYRRALATEERLRVDMPWLLTGGMANLGLGSLSLEWNDLPQAAEHLQQALKLI